MGFSYSKTQT